MQSKQTISGIYRLTYNNKHYIGSSVNIKKRIYEHFRLLKRGEHHSYKLQRAYNKYKILPEFTILEEIIDYKHLHKQEEYYINHFNSFKNGYNATPLSLGTAPEMFSEERRLKISKANKGRPAHNKGIRMTEEQKNKLSLARKGKPSPHKGKHVSEEIRIKNKEIQTKLFGKNIFVYDLYKNTILAFHSKREFSRTMNIDRNILKLTLKKDIPIYKNFLFSSEELKIYSSENIFLIG